jgi:hypothetical protein
MLYLDMPDVKRETIGARGSTRARVEVLGNERNRIGMIGMSDQSIIGSQTGSKMMGGTTNLPVDTE